MIVVTGGAGFIGSCIVRTLNENGINDIVIVDNIASTDKWKNIRNKKFITYYNKGEFLQILPKIDGVEAIIHMGAQSSTTEMNFDYLWNNNVEYTKKLWNYCAEKNISFIYASSAATYGSGTNGFDDKGNIDELIPLNGYGYSKQVFDQWVKHHATNAPKQYVGLKFFNVYGPNEYYKGSMASMVFHGFRQIISDGEIRLFKSCNTNYKDGFQLRDFVYVKDICSVIYWLLEHPNINGLYNVGTGQAQSFYELAIATFNALDMVPNIRFVDMPEHLREKYQYFTQAEMSKLQMIGYTNKFMDVNDGVTDYVQNYLSKNFLTY